MLFVVPVPGSKLGTPTNLFVQGCPDAGVCVLHKGSNAAFGLDFKSGMCIFLVTVGVVNSCQII